MFNKRNIAITLAEKSKQPGMPAIPQVPHQMTPQMSALSSMGSGQPAPQVRPANMGGMMSPNLAPVNKITNLNALPQNPYKMAGIGKIDKFPRLFKANKI